MKGFILFVALTLLAVCAFAQKPSMGEPTAKDKETLAKAEKAYKTLKANFEKHPKDAKAKKDFVAAAVVYGHESMISPALAPRVKYKQALSIYREALKLDPTNKVAKSESDTIIAIYKQMGRPVPDGK